MQLACGSVSCCVAVKPRLQRCAPLRTCDRTTVQRTAALHVHHVLAEPTDSEGRPLFLSGASDRCGAELRGWYICLGSTTQLPVRCHRRGADPGAMSAAIPRTSESNPVPRSAGTAPFCTTRFTGPTASSWSTSTPIASRPRRHPCSACATPAAARWPPSTVTASSVYGFALRPSSPCHYLGRRPGGSRG